MTMLSCYPVQASPPEIVPSDLARDWMDEVYGRHAYKCLPLNMANTSGWVIRNTTAFEATWDGGPLASNITITDLEARTDLPPLEHRARTHFGFGVLTFSVGYLFRTSPGWHMWTQGQPNRIKHGIQALQGLIETDWLPYPFTMNWRFTAPGTVRFEAGEPICFISLLQSHALDSVEPRYASFTEDPELLKEYKAWEAQRAEFNKRMYDEDPAALKQAWQRFYMSGTLPGSGRKIDTAHTNKRRLHPPK